MGVTAPLVWNDRHLHNTLFVVVPATLIYFKITALFITVIQTVLPHTTHSGKSGVLALLLRWWIQNLLQRLVILIWSTAFKQALNASFHTISSSLKITLPFTITYVQEKAPLNKTRFNHHLA
jgi:hypothetical protein